eukprot:c16739_g1_i2.p1 GENE.c16739_g1_i2~~c16739_g1_i2.p1  ORF type:complete len:378 (+),score=72.51 c16739_g1_i2:78-1211(+)
MEELPSYDEVVNGTKATGPAPGWEPSEPRTLNSVATVDVVDEPGANPIISNQYLYEDSGIAPQQHEPMCEDLAERAGPCGLLLFLLVCEFLVVLAAGLLKSSTWGVVIALVYFLAVVPVAFAIVTVKPELCRCFCSSYRIDKMCSMAFLMLVYFYMFIVPAACVMAVYMPFWLATASGKGLTLDAPQNAFALEEAKDADTYRFKQYQIPQDNSGITVTRVRTKNGYRYYSTWAAPLVFPGQSGQVGVYAWACGCHGTPYGCRNFPGVDVSLGKRSYAWRIRTRNAKQVVGFNDGVQIRSALFKARCRSAVQNSIDFMQGAGNFTFVPAVSIYDTAMFVEITDLGLLHKKLAVITWVTGAVLNAAVLVLGCLFQLIIA